MKREELKRLCEKATPGPWKPANNGPFGYSVWPRAASDVREDEHPMIADVDSGRNDDEANAAFIAAARTAVPELLAENERLRKALHDIDHALRIPAAEYVPAISDVFAIIDAALKETP